MVTLCMRTSTIALLLAVAAVNTAPLPCQAPNPAPRATLQALHILGEIPARLERISTLPDGSNVLTLFLGRVRQSLDRGDELRLFDPATEELLTTATVADDARGDTASGRIHVRVRLAVPTAAPRLGELAPSRRADFPRSAEGRDAFVREHGPRVTIVVEFEPGKDDDPANFVQIVDRRTNAPVTAADAVPTNSSFTLRFREPVDLATLHVQMLSARGPANTPVEVPMRAFALDQTNTTFRFEPALGLAFTPDMRTTALEDRDRPPAQRRPHYHLRIAAGAVGVRLQAGRNQPLAFDVPITIDPAEEDNFVGWRTVHGR